MYRSESRLSSDDLQLYRQSNAFSAATTISSFVAAGRLKASACVERCIGGGFVQCYSLSNAMEPGGRVTSKKCMHAHNICTYRTQQRLVFFFSDFPDSTFLGHLLGLGLALKKDSTHPSRHGSKAKQASLYRHPQALSAPILQTVWQSGRLVYLRPLWHG